MQSVEFSTVLSVNQSAITMLIYTRIITELINFDMAKKLLSK